MSSPSSQLPDARLVVTGHNPDGTSVFTYDDTRAPFAPFGPAGSTFTTFHASPVVPVSNTAAFPELGTTLPRPPPEGVIFCITDIRAGGRAPMHRTLSIDYTVVLSGEIVCLLDSGEEKTVKAGEFIVQRGTNHSWHNRSDQTCRMLAVMVGAEKVVVNGTTLEETVIKKPQ